MKKSGAGMTFRKHDIKSERGQTMTEFAMVLPLLVVLLFGVIQFGIAFNNYVALTDAVRAASRKGAVSRESGNPVGACTSAGYGAAGDLKASKLQVTCSSSWRQGDDVTVTGTYPYSINLLGWVVKSGNLKTQIKERVE
jgi:Flp pilus assembly protein TadG